MAATFTYNEALTTDLDKVRFLIGDSVASRQRYTNEELEAILAKHAEPTVAAGYALRILANDPVRIETLWNATLGSFARAQWMQKVSKVADRWLG